ncbi:helix-turn-helix transcriptional regulator [Sphingopyxis sp. CCNWLW253]|uniref:helix-turn-helix transcriptional regulator n=1 Tax=unclassified Sphingopyxis TaxID=2614943 RepID=UPI00301315D7
MTDKQRACLDLVLERKTSKQIARELGISKYTVDQRITNARTALGAADRDEVALRYARLRSIYHRIAYDPVEVADLPTLVASDFPDGGVSGFEGLDDNSSLRDRLSGSHPPSGKIWRHDHLPGTRLTIIATLLVALIVFLLGSLGLAESLSRLISG